MLTGTLSRFTRDEAAKILRALGAEVQSSVSKRTNILIAGESAGSKLKKARELGLTVLNEEQFLSLAENSDQNA